jgi:pimeloyl-ACP methyl ester carboxylesterase
MSVPTVSPVTRTFTLVTGMTLTVDEYGVNTDGTAVLLLHSGAGPRTLAGISAALSQHAYVLTPTHPGFDGTPRPERFDTIADLAEAYMDLLDQLDLKGVMVIGNSIGGWIGAEMALRDNHGRIAALTLLNAVGIRAVNGEQVIDTRTVPPTQIPQLSFAKAEFRPDFSKFTDEQRAVAGANQKILAEYGGDHFTYDPKLRRRLHRITIPALVLWGEQDGIAPIGYGRDFAKAFGNGHFASVADAGHFPQIEQLGTTLDRIGEFVDTVVKPDETA